MFTVDTPAGPFSVIADGSTVLASGFTTDTSSLLSLVHPSLRSAVTPTPLLSGRLWRRTSPVM